MESAQQADSFLMLNLKIMVDIKNESYILISSNDGENKMSDLSEFFIETENQLEILVSLLKSGIYFVY